jgi:hypothetical protein
MPSKILTSILFNRLRNWHLTHISAIIIKSFQTYHQGEGGIKISGIEKP